MRLLSSKAQRLNKARIGIKAAHNATGATGQKQDLVSCGWKAARWCQKEAGGVRPRIGALFLLASLEVKVMLGRAGAQGCDIPGKQLIGGFQ